MGKIKAIFNWSGGKDSAHALLRAIETGEYEIAALLTTINSESRQSTMHNLPMALLRQQAASIGIPLYTVGLTPKGNMADYSAAMAKAMEHFKQIGVTHSIFGDIFLHDIRSYRERQLSQQGITVVEPLWGKSSAQVIREFLESGLKATIVTTGETLGPGAIGRLIDKEFIDTLPGDIDPNGENGEYHTICYDGPIFKYPVTFTLGTPHSQSYDIKLEDGTTQTYTYWFADIATKK